MAGLLQGWREKYPDQQDLSDEEVVKNIAEQAPQYLEWDSQARDIYNQLTQKSAATDLLEPPSDLFGAPQPPPTNTMERAARDFYGNQQLQQQFQPTPVQPQEPQADPFEQAGFDLLSAAQEQMEPVTVDDKLLADLLPGNDPLSGFPVNTAPAEVSLPTEGLEPGTERFWRRQTKRGELKEEMEQVRTNEGFVPGGIADQLSAIWTEGVRRVGPSNWRAIEMALTDTTLLPGDIAKKLSDKGINIRGVTTPEKFINMGGLPTTGIGTVSDMMIGLFASDEYKENKKQWDGLISNAFKEVAQDKAKALEEEVDAYAKIRRAKTGPKFVGDVLAVTGQSAPMMLPAGRVSAIKYMGQIQADMKMISLAAGIQQAGGSYQDIKESWMRQGLTEPQAENMAVKEATLNGIVTAALVKSFGLTGREAVMKELMGKQGAKTIRDKMVGRFNELLKESGLEVAEEVPDQIFNDLISMMGSNPDLTPNQVLQNAIDAGFLTPFSTALTLAPNTMEGIYKDLQQGTPPKKAAPKPIELSDKQKQALEQRGVPEKAAADQDFQRLTELGDKMKSGQPLTDAELEEVRTLGQRVVQRPAQRKQEGGEPVASEKPETAKVYGDVRPQQAQAEGVPEPEGGEGVQPQAERRVPQEKVTYEQARQWLEDQGMTGDDLSQMEEDEVIREYQVAKRQQEEEALLKELEGGQEPKSKPEPERIGFRPATKEDKALHPDSSHILEMGDGEIAINVPDSGPINIDFVSAGKERRMGVGSKLVSKVKQLADSMGRPITLAATAVGNQSQEALNAFYEKQGFVQTGRKDSGGYPEYRYDPSEAASKKVSQKSKSEARWEKVQKSIKRYGDKKGGMVFQIPAPNTIGGGTVARFKSAEDYEGYSQDPTLDWPNIEAHYPELKGIKDLKPGEYTYEEVRDALKEAAPPTMAERKQLATAFGRKVAEGLGLEFAPGRTKPRIEQNGDVISIELYDPLTERTFMFNADSVYRDVKSLLDATREEIANSGPQQTRGGLTFNLKKNAKGEWEREFVAAPEEGEPIEGLDKLLAANPKSGEPLILKLYRGSGRQEAGSVYTSGEAIPILGEGRYYALSKSEAKEFGPNVEEETLYFEYPLIIKSGQQWMAIIKDAGWPYPIPSVREQGAETIQKQVETLQKKLSKVYDGVVVLWPHDSPYEVGPKGENYKTLIKVFGQSQVVAYGTPKPYKNLELIGRERAQRRVRELTEKDKLTSKEAEELMELMRGAADTAYNKARKKIPAKEINSMEARQSALPNGIVSQAHAALMDNKAIFDALSLGAVADQSNIPSPVTDIIEGRNPDVTPQQLYSAFNKARALIRKKFGDKITLYRSPESTVWVTTKEGATTQAGEFVEQSFPVDNIYAVNTGPNATGDIVVVGEPPLAPVSVNDLTVTKSKDFKLTGEWTVTYPDGQTVSLYYEPNRSAWFSPQHPLAAKKKVGYQENVPIGRTQADALKWLAQHPLRPGQGQQPTTTKAQPDDIFTENERDAVEAAATMARASEAIEVTVLNSKTGEQEKTTLVGNELVKHVRQKSRVMKQLLNLRACMKIK